MPVKPKIVTLTNSSVDILNVIRNNATVNYQNYVPEATMEPDNIREIGAIMMDNTQLQNEFLNALVNRIAKVILTSKLYENPWAMFKQGMLEFGETVEEIFVDIAKPFQFDPAVAESELYKREIPDVRSAFYVMNYQKFYKTTINQAQLKQAFLSWSGITDLVSKIINSMYTGANYDEFQTMKYMLARNILNGRLHPVEIDTVSTANMNSIVSTVKGTSNNITFLSDKYNVSGVHTNSEKSEQYIIVDADFDAKMDVEVLASAFNMTKAEFIGKRILVDGFGKLDNERLSVLFEDDDTYTAITTAEQTALNSIPCILVDKSYFMVFDNFQEFTEKFNGQGLYWNYWYHTWKTFSVSPFANAVMFLPNAPTVTSVTVSPGTATCEIGSQVQFVANVVTTNFASKAVDWTISSENATISKAGLVTLKEGATGDITVTATSVYDPTKSDTATITVS